MRVGAVILSVFAAVVDVVYAGNTLHVVEGARVLQRVRVGTPFPQVTRRHVEARNLLF